jgi:NTP pyrophosphatase (non-canonical NTP hydrolase)
MAYDERKEVAAKIQRIITRHRMNQAIADAANLITKVSHDASLAAGWWHDLKTGELIEPNIGEKLMLIVSEVSEAMEGARKNLMDDKLPHRKMIEVELADAVIRIGDLCGRLGLDLGGAIAEKLEFNAIRPDHKKENRLGENGKKF